MHPIPHSTQCSLPQQLLLESMTMWFCCCCHFFSQVEETASMHETTKNKGKTEKKKEEEKRKENKRKKQSQRTCLQVQWHLCSAATPETLMLNRPISSRARVGASLLNNRLCCCRVLYVSLAAITSACAALSDQTSSPRPIDMTNVTS